MGNQGVAAPLRGLDAAEHLAVLNAVLAGGNCEAETLRRQNARLAAILSVLAMALGVYDLAVLAHGLR